MHVLIKKFKPAWEGMKLCFKDKSVLTQFFFAGCVILFGIIVQFHAIEWMVIMGCIGFVLVTEILNSALEELCDLVDPNYNLKIKRIKDIAAAGVLMASLTAVVLGFCVLGGVFR